MSILTFTDLCYFPSWPLKLLTAVGRGSRRDPSLFKVIGISYWECSALDQTSTATLPSLEAQGTLQEMGQKECKKQRMRSAVKYCLSSGHYMAVTYMNWQQLWLLAQDMYKTKPVKILAWDMEQTGMESHRRVSFQPGIPIMIYQMSPRIVWFKGIKDALLPSNIVVGNGEKSWSIFFSD